MRKSVQIFSLALSIVAHELSWWAPNDVAQSSLRLGLIIGVQETCGRPNGAASFKQQPRGAPLAFFWPKGPFGQLATCNWQLATGN